MKRIAIACPHALALAVGLVLAVAVMAPTLTLAAGPAPLDLRSATRFTILAGTAISSTGDGTINGNVGLSPATGAAITGLSTGQVSGTLYTVDAAGPAGAAVDPGLLTTAKVDLATAYDDAAGRSAGRITVSGNIGGQTLIPGLYGSASSLEITGDLTLDAGGDANAVWIFQMGSTLTTAAGGAGDPHSRVILTGGAQANNVFWQVGSSATLGTYSIFKGTLLAAVSITMDTGSTPDGRALAQAGAVTFNSLSGNLTILSISVSPSAWTVGTVGTGTVQMSSAGSRLTVTNSGTVAETFTLMIAGEDDRNEWTHSPSKTGAGDKRYVFSGVFCAAADAPGPGSFSQAADDDVLTTSAQAATATQFACTEGTATGVAVPVDAGRSLWFRLDTPTAGTGGIEHTITLRVGCFQP